MSQDFISAHYGHRLRVRVCGILIEKDEILLVKHKSIGRGGHLWIPPGGASEFGSNVKDNLIREFQEETGLDITVQDLLFLHEYLEPPLHSIELFFEVQKVGGELKKGHDPELTAKNQIIETVKFVSFEEIGVMNKNEVHNIFTLSKDKDELLKMRGYFKFENNSLK